ncbi:hypothetical protein [Bradyrhizobium japonicum]|uniref:hypothetical protein n=1 Tax=Bradyrhizobium japonicum TaxID=375 RepID=UPI001364DDA9|nr:hypothetical protein [Bradyrhizobium japonicum]
MEALILVAESGGPTMFARIGVLRALNRKRPPTEAALLLRLASVENERSLKHTLDIRSHLDSHVLPYVRKVLRQARKRIGGLDLGLSLSLELKPFFIGIEAGVVPDIEVVPDHGPLALGAESGGSITFLNQISAPIRAPQAISAAASLASAASRTDVRPSQQC